MLLSVGANTKGKHTYRTWTEQFLLRLTPAQKDRLEAASKHAGKKMTDFVRDIVMRHIDDVETQHAANKEKKREERREAFVPHNLNAPKGLNLRPRTAPVVETPVDEVPAPAAPTVVVHNHQTTPNELDRLASYVFNAPNTIERQERERQVQKILSDSSDPVESARVARALDEKIAALQHKSPEKASWTRWLTG